MAVSSIAKGCCGLIGAIALLLSTAGCASMAITEHIGKDQTDLSIVEIGAEKSEIEEVFGAPMTGYEGAAGKSVTYDFNKGIEPVDDTSIVVETLAAAAYVYLWPIAIPLDLENTNCVLECQKGLLTVVYDSSERLSAFYPESYDKGDCPCSGVKTLPLPETINTGKNYKVRSAVNGNVNSQYELGSESTNPAQKSYWLCSAAKENHEDAALDLMEFYRFGLAGFPRDNVEAYKWRLIASRMPGGAPIKEREQRYFSLEPAEEANARDMADNWKRTGCSMDARTLSTAIATAE